MGSKTPVSILQEMMIRKGSPPQYDLIYNGGGTHEAIFKYRVYAGEITAIGSGHSKKEAKHDAAKCVLERLKAVEPTGSSEPVEEEALEVPSPYKDKIQENAIGDLQDLCATNDIPRPEYVLIGDEGPPHARQFTYLCKVSKQQELGVGRTKKQAKQLAAFNMLTGLRNSLGDILDLNIDKGCGSGAGSGAVSGDKTQEVPSAEGKKAISRYVELVGSAGRRIAFGQRLSDYHLILTHLPTEEIDKAMVRQQNKDANDLELLLDLVEKLHLEYTFENVESYDEKKVLVLLVLSSITISGTHTDSVHMGMDTSMELAKLNAATQALQYLLIMTKKPKIVSQPPSGEVGIV